MRSFRGRPVAVRIRPTANRRFALPLRLQLRILTRRQPRPVRSFRGQPLAVWTQPTAHRFASTTTASQLIPWASYRLLSRGSDHRSAHRRPSCLGDVRTCAARFYRMPRPQCVLTAAKLLRCLKVPGEEIPAHARQVRRHMLSPLPGTSAAPVHRLLQCISWLPGGSFCNFMLHLRPRTPGGAGTGAVYRWLVRLRASA